MNEAAETPTPMTMLEKLGLVIEMASNKRFVGLYDYSGYHGTEPPHVVRDEETGREVFRSSDPLEARRVYGRMKRDAVALAALAALRDPDDALLLAMDSVQLAANERAWAVAIDHIAKGEG